MKIELEQVKPADIEKRSFEIIESELPHDIDSELAPIIKRAVHTSADFDYVDNLCFSEDVVSKALESIKNGVLYSKDSGDGDTYSMIPPTDDVVSDYSVDITKDNGQKVHIGNYSTVEELNEAISDAVKTGQLTKEEAEAARQCNK